MSVFKRWRTKKGPDGQPVRYQEEFYTIKIIVDGKQKIRPSGCRNKEEALKRQREIVLAGKSGRIHEVLEKLRVRHDNTLGQLLKLYIEAGYPDEMGAARDPRALNHAKLVRTVELLSRWGTGLPLANLKDRDQDTYHEWRLANVPRRTGTGERATEMELVVLRSIMRWACRKGHIDHVPFTMAFTYHPGKQVRHARDFMPESAEEIHAIAHWVFAHLPASACYGWELLLASATGLRHAELRQLRAYPRRLGLRCEPGWMDDRYLVVVRAKGGKNPQVQLDDPSRPYIRTVLERIRAWHAAHHPESPWLLCRQDGTQMEWQARATYNVLPRAAKALGVPARHAHGFRAYYASVRLSQGIGFDQVAFELGHRSGDDLVRNVYGMEPDEWRGLPNTYRWIPADPKARLAWDAFLHEPLVVSLDTDLDTTKTGRQLPPIAANCQPIAAQSAAKVPASEQVVSETSIESIVFTVAG